MVRGLSVSLTYDAGACVFRQLHYRLLIHWISVDNGNKASPFSGSSPAPPTLPAVPTSVAAHKFVHKLTQSGPMPKKTERERVRVREKETKSERL